MRTFFLPLCTAMVSHMQSNRTHLPRTGACMCEKQQAKSSFFSQNSHVIRERRTFSRSNSRHRHRHHTPSPTIFSSHSTFFHSPFVSFSTFLHWFDTRIVDKNACKPLRHTASHWGVKEKKPKTHKFIHISVVRLRVRITSIFFCRMSFIISCCYT